MREHQTGSADQAPTVPDLRAQQPRRKRRGLVWRIARWSLLALLLLAVLGAGGLAMLFYVYGRDLPRVDSLAHYNPPTVTRVYARGGELIGEFAQDDGYRTVVPLKRIPGHVVDAVLAAEDAGFRSHEGLDYWGMIRAFFVNLLSGRFKQGGSTITQQVVKTFLLSPEKTIGRKVKEVILARRLEDKLSKDDILTLYLNQIYFGHRRYGVEEAARFYFGKSIADVNLGEAAMLAGLIKSPGRFSPRLHPKHAKARQREVLRNLLKASRAGKLSRRYRAAEVEAAAAAPLVLAHVRHPYLGAAPYYVHLVKQQVQKQLGKEAFYRRDLRVETACDIRLQAAARRALRLGLHRVERRRGYHGPLARLSPAKARRKAAALAKSVQAVVVGQLYKGVVLSAGRRSARIALGPVTATLPLRQVRWARLGKRRRRPRRVADVVSPGDVVLVRVTRLGGSGRRSGDSVVVALEQSVGVQGAVVALDPHSRDVLAVVGGYDYAQSPFNRAVQARRQPGSAFKAVVYSAAIRTKRYTPATIVLDNPAVYGRIFSRHAYRPHNYDRRYRGEVRLRTALAQSLNLVAVKVADDIGIDAVREEAGLLGIESPISKNLAVALGADSVTPLELGNAFAVFASGGTYRRPRFVRRVVTRQGKGRVLWAPRNPPRQAMTPEQAYVMTSLLRGPVEERRGTARRVARLGYLVAGKTGTTNRHRDAWFVGYTPEVLAAVWVGHDDREPLGRFATGGSSAAPIWLDLMRTAMRGRPRTTWRRPVGIEMVRIDPRTGLRAAPGQVDAIEEVFLAGTAPREQVRPPGATTPETLLLDETRALAP